MIDPMKQPPTWIQKAYHLDNVLLDCGNEMVIRRRLAIELENVCYKSHIEPKNVSEKLNDESHV